MSSSYFDLGCLTTRFLSFYGNTGDLFVDESLYPQTIQQALHRELTVHGYERIIFYSYADGAYFLDSRSQKLWHGRQTAPAEPDTLFPSPLLRGRLRPRPEPVTRQAFTISPAEMLSAAERFLNDSDIPTAIIFADGVEAIREFCTLENGKVLGSFFAHVTEGAVNRIMNRNVAIFLFNRSAAQVDAILSTQEKESANKYLHDPALTTMHVIPMPNHREVRGLLNFLRVWGHRGRTLNISCRELDACSRLISGKLARNRAEEKRNPAQGELYAHDLKGALRFLVREFVNTERPLDETACRQICRSGIHTALERLNNLVGIDAVKTAMDEFLESQAKTPAREVPVSRLARPEHPPESQRPNLHFVLAGNRGTGKTTVARLLGEILCEYGYLSTGHTIEVQPSQLMRPDAESELRRLTERAMGGVLFIDEAYALADGAHAPLIAQILADMNNHKGEYSLILAGYPDRMDHLMTSTNDGWKGRFGNNWISIADYTPPELTEIFLRMAADRDLTVSDQLQELLPVFLENWYYAKRITGWDNAREIENLLDTMSKRSRDLTPELIPQDLVPYTNDQDTAAAMAELDSLIGLGAVKAEIRKMMLHMRYNGESPPRHFIFAGNPGTGKTTVAKLLGRILKHNGILKSGHLVQVVSSDLISGYVGNSALNARRIFDSALDGVLFIDEAYSLVPTSRNGQRETDYGGAVLDLLTSYIQEDGKPLCVVCAGYEAEMKGFEEYNRGLPRRFKWLSFESYSLEDLMEILKQSLSRKGYTADPEYFAKAREDFERNLTDIQARHNGGYITTFVRDSQDQLFVRLNTEYGDKEVPEDVLHRFTAADAPCMLLKQENLWTERR